ncbi:hypothetical protein [Ammoniphilus sp. 3BR4]|uniref:hypothetical protein n=1 Tax=Ammoniphilus sp. 3BR4 TaxID=3158265 RepID=UPI003467DE57
MMPANTGKWVRLYMDRLKEEDIDLANWGAVYKDMYHYFTKIDELRPDEALKIMDAFQEEVKDEYMRFKMGIGVE